MMGERDGKHTRTPRTTRGEETATGWPGVCCTDFELLAFRRGLETVCRHFLASHVGFEAHKIAQNSITGREAFVWIKVN